MPSRKLIVTHRGRLIGKYGEAGAEAIDLAVRDLAVADEVRGIKTLYVHLDDVDEMKAHGSKAATKAPSAATCKRVIDKILTSLSFDYLVLLGADDVIPHFRVANPTYAEEGDTDHDVPTDNPYAATVRFKADSRPSYLVPDRVVGRIPDLPGATEPKYLIEYLRSAAAMRPLDIDEFALDLLICCDAWKTSGQACVSSLMRNLENLFISPPSIDTTKALADRYAARLQMIKCHGAPLDPSFYGQRGGDFPVVLSATSLDGRTAKGTVVGAMCCYGAAVYDPGHLGAIESGVPAIASVYLRQGASGFAGSTGIAWVGAAQPACADLVVTYFLNGVMQGASLGAALLDAKQRFLADINKEGRMPDAAEEKTLLQFVLLGDASLCPVLPPNDHLAAVVPAEGLAWGGGDALTKLFGEAGHDYRLLIRHSPAMAAERKSRRAFHYKIGEDLRDLVPQRELIEPGGDAARLLTDTEIQQLGNVTPVVHRMTRVVAQLQRSSRRAIVPATMLASVGESSLDDTTSRLLREETLQYYWFASTRHERVIDATAIKVETDLRGNVLRKRTLVTA